MTRSQRYIESTLRNAFEKSAEEIRTLNPKDNPNSYTEADFQCLLYHNLLVKLGRNSISLLQAEEPFVLKMPNPLGQSDVSVDITLGTAPGRTNILVEIKPFFGYTLRHWRERSKDVHADVRKLAEIISQMHKRIFKEEKFSATLQGFVVVPLLGKDLCGFDPKIIKHAKALNTRLNGDVSILVA